MNVQVLSGRRFRPALWAILLYMLVLVIMLALGRWQLIRADEKIALQQAADTARQAVPIDLSLVDPGKLEALASSYARVSVKGQWQTDQQFLWDNRSHEGRAGFEVITPLLLADGRYVLVNRGWIAPGASRSDLPDVSLHMSRATQSPSSEKGFEVSLNGLFSRPSRGFAQGSAISDTHTWPRILQYFGYASISEALGAQVLPGVVQVLDASVTEQSVNSSPIWLIPNWQPAASGPAKHYSYAFQWFAMAVGLSVLFVVTNLSRRSDAAEEDSRELPG